MLRRLRQLFAAYSNWFNVHEKTYLKLVAKRKAAEVQLKQRKAAAAETVRQAKEMRLMALQKVDELKQFKEKLDSKRDGIVEAIREPQVAQGGMFVLEREALVAFYEKHEPSKRHAADALLDNFDHQELVQALQAKYGEAPQLTMVPSARGKE